MNSIEDTSESNTMEDFLQESTMTEFNFPFTTSVESIHLYMYTTLFISALSTTRLWFPFWYSYMHTNQTFDEQRNTQICCGHRTYHKPFLAITGEIWWLVNGHRWCHGLDLCGAGWSFKWCWTGAQSWILVGLHFRRHFLQTCSNITAVIRCYRCVNK